jgi:Lrp/AsnC family transcriptional regulator, leucine-responsive regulatory protein
MAMDALDGFDWRILGALQDDARMSNIALAERVLLSPSQCARRLQRLEEAGVIRGYAALLDPDRIGLSVAAYISITLEKHGAFTAEAFREAVQRHPEIVECCAVTGDADYELRVVAPDLKDLSRFIMDSLMRIDGVSAIRSRIVLDTIKDSRRLPLPPMP